MAYKHIENYNKKKGLQNGSQSIQSIEAVQTFEIQAASLQHNSRGEK